MEDDPFDPHGLYSKPKPAVPAKVAARPPVGAPVSADRYNLGPGFFSNPNPAPTLPGLTPTPATSTNGGSFNAAFPTSTTPTATTPNGSFVASFPPTNTFPTPTTTTNNTNFANFNTTATNNTNFANFNSPAATTFNPMPSFSFPPANTSPPSSSSNFATFPNTSPTPSFAAFPPTSTTTTSTSTTPTPMPSFANFNNTSTSAGHSDPFGAPFNFNNVVPPSTTTTSATNAKPMPSLTSLQSPSGTTVASSAPKSFSGYPAPAPTTAPSTSSSFSSYPTPVAKPALPSKPAEMPNLKPPLATTPKEVTPSTPSPPTSFSSYPTANTRTNLAEKANELVQGALLKLEKGVFDGALDDTNQALNVLVSAKETQDVKKEVKVCVTYKLALRLLIEIKRNETNIPRAALLTRILADLNSVQVKHKVVCVRMAINKNMEARNFKLAARLIETLLPMGLKDHHSLEEKLKACNDNKLKDNLIHPYTCPSCGYSTDPNESECTVCYTKIQFCFQTFTPIMQPSFLECNFCDSVFASSSASPSQKCPACNGCGTLHVISIATTASGASSSVGTTSSTITKPAPALPPKVPKKEEDKPVVSPPSFASSGFDVPPSQPQPFKLPMPPAKSADAPETAKPVRVLPSGPAPAKKSAVPKSVSMPEAPQKQESFDLGSLDYKPNKPLPAPSTNKKPIAEQLADQLGSEPFFDPGSAFHKSSSFDLSSHAPAPSATTPTPTTAPSFSAASVPAPSFSAPPLPSFSAPPPVQSAPPVPEKKMQKSSSAPDPPNGLFNSSSFSSYDSAYSSADEAFVPTTTPPATPPTSRPAPPTRPAKPLPSTTPGTSSAELPGFATVEIVSLDVITDEERATYAPEFDVADTAGNGVITGPEARTFFLKFGVPKKDLATIWRLSDYNQDGKLDRAEFIVAMHFLTCCLKGIYPLPSSLPSSLILSNAPAPISSPPQKNVPLPPLPKFSSAPSATPSAHTTPPIPPLTGSTSAGSTFAGSTFAGSTSADTSSLPSYPAPAPESRARAQTLPAQMSPPVSTSGPSAGSFIAPPASTSPAGKGDSKGKKDKDKEKEKEDKKKHRFSTLLRKKKNKEEEQPHEEKSTGPPTLFAPPPVLEEPEIASPTPARVEAPVAPPPSLFTPPMLPNTIVAVPAAPVLSTPPMLSNTMVTRPSSRITEATPPPPPPATPPPPLPTPPVEREEASPPATELPPPPSPVPEVPSPRPAPVAVKPQFEITRQWQFFSMVTQGSQPAPRDFLSDVPREIAFVGTFIYKLLKEGSYDACFWMLSDQLKHSVTTPQLASLGSYYGNLFGLWYSQAHSYAHKTYTTVYIPLYFFGESHQAKLWVSPSGDQIVGLEFKPLNEASWTAEGVKAAVYTIAQPRVVKKADGSLLELHSLHEIEEAMVDAKVPLCLQAGPEKTYRMKLKQQLELKQKTPSLVRKGADGKKYIVFSEVSVNENTLRAHPEAYAREYWIPHKHESIAYVSLLNRQGDYVSDDTWVELANGQLESLAVYRKEKKKKEVSKITPPALEHFYVLCRIPPEMNSQSMVLNSIRGLPNGFVMSDQRTYSISVPPGEKKASVEIEWEISMRPVRLAPRCEGEEYIKEERRLHHDDRKDALASTADIDHIDKSFRDYLGKLNLLKDIFGYKETDVQFAQRAYIALVKEFVYFYPSEFTRSSDLVKAKRGDSAAINKVYVATLRANDIPARMLYGRFAQSKQKGQTFSWIGSDTGVEYEQQHTQCQFYVDGVGWIPVDLSMSVRNKNPNFNEQVPDTFLGGFGETAGNFITLGVDRGLVDVPVYGPRNDLQPDDFTNFFKHKKLTSEWTVQ